MAISDKLLQVNQVKQDIKTAIEAKEIPMTNVAFTEYANKILEISGGANVPYLIYDGNEPLHWSWAYYIYSQSDALENLSNAWQHSLEVDIAEIEKNSTDTTKYGCLQYPNGETFGVIIPDGTTSIGEFAFYEWSSNNQPLVIPNSVTSIKNYVFYRWNSNKQPLVIPNSVTSIGKRAFYEWSANNQPLVIPNSVTSIDNYAFSYWLSNNQPLVIPESVTSIGSYAFSYWSLVPYIEVKAVTPPSLGSATAFESQNNAPIYVPDESVDDYKGATNWIDLADRIKPISEKQ